MARKFSDYINGRLVRFLEHEERLYVDSDDLLLLMQELTRH